MIFIWVHNWWMYDEFLGLFNAWHMIFWVISSKSNFSICIKKLLDKVNQNCIEHCAGEIIVDLQLQAHASRRFLLDADQRTCPSLIDWNKISFWFAFYLFTNYIVHSLKHVLIWTFWPSECSICSYFRMICKTNFWCNQS